VQGFPGADLGGEAECGADRLPCGGGVGPADEGCGWCGGGGGEDRAERCGCEKVDGASGVGGSGIGEGAEVHPGVLWRVDAGGGRGEAVGGFAAIVRAEVPGAVDADAGGGDPSGACGAGVGDDAADGVAGGGGCGEVRIQQSGVHGCDVPEGAWEDSDGDASRGVSRSVSSV